MDSQGQVRLRWTSHQGTVVSLFEALYSSQALVDVTIACEGQYLQAHRLVLSACSPYFQELLSLDMSKNPIIFLKGVKYSELQALIHYMYRGEVNIAHEELPSLLVVAQELKIRGLAEMETSNGTSDTIIIPETSKSSNKISISNLSTSSTLGSTTFSPLSSRHHRVPNITQVSSNTGIAHTPSISKVTKSRNISSPPPAKRLRPSDTHHQKSQSQLPPRVLSPAPQDTITDGASENFAEFDQPGGAPQELDPLALASTVQTQSSEYAEDNAGVAEGFHFVSEVKLEMEDGMIQDGVDLDLEEGNNSMSQSSFVDSWRIGGEGDASNFTEEDVDVPSGSRPIGEGDQKCGSGDGILNELTQMRKSISSLARNQNFMRNSLVNIERKVNNLIVQKMDSNKDVMFIVPKPIKSLKKFEALETELRNSEKRNKFKNQFESYEGFNLSGCVNQIMRKLMAPPLASKFTQYGLGTGKENFSSTIACNVVIRILLNRNFEFDLIKNTLAEWFRRSGERLKSYLRKEGPRDGLAETLNDSDDEVVDEVVT